MVDLIIKDTKDTVESISGDIDESLDAIKSEKDILNDSVAPMEGEKSTVFKESDLDSLPSVSTEDIQTKLNESANLYYFNKLSADEKLIYAQILDILTNLDEGRVLSTTDIDLIDKVASFVQYDHPEIFYIDGTSYMKYMIGDEVRKVTFAGQYTMPPEAVEAQQILVDSYVNRFAASFYLDYPDGTDDYHLIKYAYEYIVKNTEYVSDSPDNQNILSVMINGQSVCQGYTKTMQYLLQAMGVDCTMVSGVAKGTPHSWNLVKSDGEYYYVDVTWGDPSYSVNGEEENIINSVPPVNYDFLLITTSDLKNTHVIDHEDILPVCTATKDNYYIRENVYFTQIDDAKLRNAFDRAYANGDAFVTLKMSDSDIYQAMWDYLLEQQNIFNYLKDMTSVSYAENIEQRYMVFWI